MLWTQRAPPNSLNTAEEEERDKGGKSGEEKIIYLVLGVCSLAASSHEAAG